VENVHTMRYASLRCGQLGKFQMVLVLVKSLIM
jgi:hypothetical protein